MTAFVTIGRGEPTADGPSPIEWMEDPTAPVDGLSGWDAVVFTGVSHVPHLTLEETMRLGFSAVLHGQFSYLTGRWRARIVALRAERAA